MDKPGPVAPITQIMLERPDVLSAPKKGGFHRRWIRDTEEDVERMGELGYQVVKKDGGSELVRRRELVLMEIPQSLYEDRLRAKVARVHARRSARNIRQAAASETDRLAAAPELKGVVKTIGDVSITGGTSDS